MNHFIAVVFISEALVPFSQRDICWERQSCGEKGVVLAFEFQNLGLLQ